MKLSKASWMILGAGIFIIVLAGMGVARSGQLKTQASINEELAVVSTRLNNVNSNQFQMEISELEQQLKDINGQVVEAKDRLKQNIISVDVSEKFYDIADYYHITITSFSSTTISDSALMNIGCEMISVSATVDGKLTDMINFIIGLNNNYATGFAGSAQLSVSQVTGQDYAAANVQMTVYTLKEGANGN